MLKSDRTRVLVIGNAREGYNIFIQASMGRGNPRKWVRETFTTGQEAIEVAMRAKCDIVGLMVKPVAAEVEAP